MKFSLGEESIEIEVKDSKDYELTYEEVVKTLKQNKFNDDKFGQIVASDEGPDDEDPEWLFVEDTTNDEDFEMFEDYKYFYLVPNDNVGINQYISESIREEDMKLVDYGDGLEYEVWEDKSGQMYRVPIDRNTEEEEEMGEVRIERYFDEAEKVSSAHAAKFGEDVVKESKIMSWESFNESLINEEEMFTGFDPDEDEDHEYNEDEFMYDVVSDLVERTKVKVSESDDPYYKEVLKYLKNSLDRTPSI